MPSLPFIPGLVSVTFRNLSPGEIISLVGDAGLESIEWGGDIHVPHGDVKIAREIGEQTRAAGLLVAAYGSYYRLAVSEDEGLAFSDVLATGDALGAPLIRVWAGNRGSADADPDYRNAVAADAVRITSAAAEKGIKVALEYHANTLTDTSESALALLAQADHSNLFTLWQPPNGQDKESCLRSLRAVRPRLSNLHVFHWWPDNKDRRPLSEGRERWQAYLEEAAADGAQRHALLEFVKDGCPDHFLRDAATLLQWVRPGSSA